MSTRSDPPRPAAAVAAALAAAALFGASAPVAKILLRDLPPLVLSSLLYLGAGLGLAATRVLFAARVAGAARAPGLRRADAPVLLGMVVAGGILAPLALLLGLGRVSGVAGSLLLNLEAPFTIGLAVAALGESFGRRELGASVAILAGSCLLALQGGEGLRANPVGVLAIAAACAGWAVDNNLTQRLSGRDPVSVAGAKSVLAGAASAILALLLGARIPAARPALAAMLLGFASYGASLVLVVAAMRTLGAAREAAFFSTAPFAGALLSVPLLGDRLGPTEIAAGALMAVGVALLAAAGSPDLHEHGEEEHEHLHRHDEHHLHAHVPGDPTGEPHAHFHRHGRLRHAHARRADAHHGPGA